MPLLDTVNVKTFFVDARASMAVVDHTTRSHHHRWVSLPFSHASLIAVCLFGANAISRIAAEALQDDNASKQRTDRFTTPMMRQFCLCADDAERVLIASFDTARCNARSV